MRIGSKLGPSAVNVIYKQVAVMSKLPPELSYVLELAKPPTIEEELEMEKAIRQALTIEDVDELHRCVEAILRQNHQQGIFISRSLDQIHLLTAKLACAENRVIQPEPSWFSKLLSTFRNPKL